MKVRAGLTLVELLASLVIAAMLMAAALGATVSLARSELAVRRQAAGPEPLRPALEDLVGSDLLHAHHYREARDGFAVETDVRLAAGTLRLEHVPAVVTYQVRKVGEQSCLLRTQETAPEPPRTELVALGVGGAALVPQKEGRANAYGWKPMTGPCAVRLAFGQAGSEGAALVVRVPGRSPDSR